jgi:hypothetical protein
MEATKCLKPSDNGHEFGDRSECVVREPDAVNPPVRFDERDVETEPRPNQ